MMMALFYEVLSDPEAGQRLAKLTGRALEAHGASHRSAG